jgi:two-component system, NtrC family, response regulator HydG
VKSKPLILLVDDDDAFRTVMGGELGRAGFEIAPAATGGEALRLAADRQPQVVVLDLDLPDMTGLQVLERLRAACPSSEVLMLTGHGSIDTAIQSIRAGAFDYVAKPCPLDELEVRIQRALERYSLTRRATLLERGLTPPDLGHAFVGQSPQFRAVVELMGRVAASDAAVLITGETGSGKEIVAKLLHARSHRRDRPFVVVECAGLQESLLQSELFGHERGAFTGADRAKPGLFEVAHGGTIFLDEIGEVSASTQVKLLRVLDASTFRHVGGTSEITIDVRLLAATNRDLSAMVRQGQFREDLFYRLSTIALHLPPLRERPGDIDLLARHFVTQLDERRGGRHELGEAALEVLRRHTWPGNVRELKHVIEAALLVCDGADVRPEHLPASLRGQPAADPAGALPTLDQLEREHIRRVLDAVQDHRAQAARILGISERNLYRKLRDYGWLMQG